MKQLLFLNFLNAPSDRSITSAYRKIRFTGLLQNDNSFVSLTYKKGLITTLITELYA